VHYLLAVPAADDTLLARVRRVVGSPRGKMKKRRESVSASSCNGAPLSSVLDIGFSSVFVQALNQVYQGLCLCSSRHNKCPTKPEGKMHNFFNKPLLDMSDMMYTAAAMPNWVVSEWNEFCSEPTTKNCWEHLDWQLHFAQTIIAAEQARIFLQKLVNLELMKQIGNTAGVWDKLESFAETLRRQGLPEDAHFALISNMRDFYTILSTSFISTPKEGEPTAVEIPVLAGMAVDPLFMIGTLKSMAASSEVVDPSTTRKTRVTAKEKEFIKESMESCTFIYDFPTFELDPTSNLSGANSANRKCFDHYNSDYTEEEEEEES
jgi:hypothetical protein